MLKKLLFAAVFISAALFAQSQEPVKWTFTAKKISDKTYEVRISAKIAQPWSIYSQSTPEGGPLPTAITFGKNPLLKLDDKTKEQGTMKKKHEEVFDVDVLYYKDKVDFVQIVKVKTNVKTNVTGTVEFMACDDEQCLPPKSIPFSIALN